MWIKVPFYFFPSQRPAERQIGPEDEEDRKETASQKRSVPGFVFRPSTLQKATQGFALKQATLEPALSKLSEWVGVLIEYILPSSCIVHQCTADFRGSDAGLNQNGGLNKLLIMHLI